jgi:hypothetical protein
MVVSVETALALGFLFSTHLRIGVCCRHISVVQYFFGTQFIINAVVFKKWSVCHAENH